MAGFSKDRLVGGANQAQDFDEGKYDPIDDVITQEGYDLTAFTVESVLEILDRNSKDWSKEGREKYWRNPDEVRSYIEREFHKRGIPLPKGFKSKK